jgi:hypothetical protein
VAVVFESLLAVTAESNSLMEVHVALSDAVGCLLSLLGPFGVRVMSRTCECLLRRRFSGSNRTTFLFLALVSRDQDDPANDLYRGLGLRAQLHIGGTADWMIYYCELIGGRPEYLTHQLRGANKVSRHDSNGWCSVTL